jgi:quinol monooxygenase YgiN
VELPLAVRLGQIWAAKELLIMLMYIHHEVTDYAAWRKVYDAFDGTRKELGVIAQAVYQSVDNPNDVTATHDFDSAAKAKAFAASPELKAAMGKAGVKGKPQIWITTKAAK